MYSTVLKSFSFITISFFWRRSFDELSEERDPEGSIKESKINSILSALLKFCIIKPSFFFVNKETIETYCDLIRLQLINISSNLKLRSLINISDQALSLLYKQDVTQGLFFKPSTAGLNSEFSFSYAGYGIKVKGQSALLSTHFWRENS